MNKYIKLGYISRDTSPTIGPNIAFLQQNYGLGLGFRFGLSVDPLLYCFAPQ